jgi:hypothetical protein
MVLWPSIAFKASPQTMRVLRPIAADRMVLEGWSFRAKGAPDLLLERSITYNRVAFSPMSLVALDDVGIFESAQRALRASGNEWVSLHRGHRAGEEAADEVETNGTNEILMRNQFRAWARFMAGTAGTPAVPA